MYTYKNIAFSLLLFGFIILSCSEEGRKEMGETNQNPATEKVDPNDWTKNKGVGPIKEISLAAEIDADLSEKGKSVFELKCSACHKVTKRYIGPSPQNILERRTPEWVMNMILNPEGMVAEDPIAKQLLMEYNGTPMANQNLTEEEARAILEYFRTL